MGDNVRELASAFSTRVLRELSRPHPATWARERIAPVAALVEGDSPLSVAFEVAYQRLVGAYRCEHVYKTAVIQHALATEPTANAMTGLPVFLSIADVVVAGNAASAFEIKTDLDSLARLELQLVSYSRCFEYVHVVTSQAKASRVIDELPDHVGVLAVDDSVTLSAVRPAVGGYSRINTTSLFRVLRQGERLAVLERQLGYSADVPSARLYHRTAELFSGLSTETAYTEFVTELRNRDARQRIASTEAGLPPSLIAAAAGLTLSAVAWQRLGHLLKRPAAPLTDTTHGWAA